MCGWESAARNWASTARSIIPLLCSSSGRSGRRVLRTYCCCWVLVGKSLGGEEVEVAGPSSLDETSAANAARDLASSLPVS